jgi:hypothetical protein
MSMANDPESRVTDELLALVQRQIELVRQDDGAGGLKRLETSLKCLSLWRQNIVLTERIGRPGRMLDLDKLSDSELQKVCELFPQARSDDA